MSRGESGKHVRGYKGITSVCILYLVTIVETLENTRLI